MIEFKGRTWYHGSPLPLTLLRKGSTITPDIHLARVFAAKPSLVCVEDNGTMKHDGAITGFVHVIDEPVQAEDIYPHPRTRMAPGQEWLTRRDLRLKVIEQTEIIASEVLTPTEIAQLRSKATSETF